jgi:hypothetical protein
MKRHTFSDIRDFDNELYQLALYEITEGKIIIPKSSLQLVKLQEKVAEKFNYYKKLIQDGECTLDFIKQDVLGTYGPFPRVKNKMDYDDIAKYSEESISNSEDLNKPIDMSTVLRALLNRLSAETEANNNIYPSCPDEDLGPFYDDDQFDFPEDEKS